MTVDPTGADLKRFMQEDPGGPVVMLNLLRFVEGGRTSYEQYSREIRPYVDQVGARIVYAGNTSTVLAAPDGFGEWDAVLLVEYPNRAAFSQMVADPDYQGITHLRTQALSHAVLQATVPWT